MTGRVEESEAALPERRRFSQIVGGVNLLFLAFDARSVLPHREVVLGARVLLTAWLFGGALLLSRPRFARWGRVIVRAEAVLLALTFAALVWGSGGVAGYGLFFGFIPLVLAVGAPDDPVAIVLCGVTVWAGGLVAMGGDALFWSLGTGAVTLYAAAGAWFHREGLRRQSAERRDAEALARRLAELERQRALDDRLSLLGRLVADVAHELRNPLTYVSANVSLLREGIDGGAVSEALSDVETGLSRIGGLIDDLRAFAKNEPEPLAACDLGPILEEALRISSVRLLAIAKIEQAIAPGLPRVTGSARRLSQVLVNLLINAADALEHAPLPRRVRVTAREDGGAVLLSVEDNGPGIAPEIRDRLFTPFATTKGTKGTGLGLSLSRDYLSSFGATIEAGSSELGGARFSLRLPKALVEPAPPT